MSEAVTRRLQAETIDQPRRRFFGSAAMTIAAAQLGVIASATAQTGKASQVPVVKPGPSTSFKLLKRINAGLLNVGYAEDGLSDGPPVMLLHGWPYDIHRASFTKVELR